VNGPPLWIVALAGLALAAPALAIHCGDCGSPVECGSALSCMNKLPGTPCGPGLICIDLNHPACGLLIKCCGCQEGLAQGAVFDPHRAIPDGDPAGITSTLTLTESRIVVDLDVYLEINHTWIGDLVVTLTHDGTTVTLIDRPGDPATPGGCDADLACGSRIYLGDEGDTSIECTPENCSTCFPGGQVEARAYIPVEALSTFDGFDVLGDWELRVSDLSGGDAGEICAWGIVIVGAGPVPTEAVSWGTVKSTYR
jgi:subtilisin-like proprotein convertase family protein